MISALWKACTDADLPKVQEILTDTSGLDIESKDATGATALVHAIRSGNADVVRAVLDAGADPSSVMAYGGTDQLTSDAAILALLPSTGETKQNDEAPPTTYYLPENYSQDYTQDPSKAYYSHPHGSYMYYPSIMPGAAIMPDGAAPYYPPPPPPPSSAQPPTDPNGGSNLPPPEIARLIPCRYFPACRYGPSCIFLHPQGPYFQGPLPPPAQYPAPYDPSLALQQPYPTYYPAPYPPPTGVPHPNAISPPPVSQQSPQSLPTHGRPGSELVSPVQAAYNPPLPPPPMQYGMPPPLPFPPTSMAQIPPHAPAQQNMVMYSAVPTSPVMQTNGIPFAHRRNSSAAQPHAAMNGPVRTIDANGVPQNQNVQQPPDIPFQRPAHRDALNARRGSIRRASTVGMTRKPPCLFFPSGRCRNGDDCRFPHVLSDAHVPNSAPHFQGKFPRPRPSMGDSLEERMNGLSIRQNTVPENATVNGFLEGRQDVNSRPQNHFKNGSIANGIRNDKRPPVTAARQQRIPNPEDFPVLAGSITPPSRSPQSSGLTAAQVLQAPPPTRKDAVKPAQNGITDQTLAQSPRDDEPNKEKNGSHVNDNAPKPPTFASVTSPAPATLDTPSPSHVSVSA